MTVPCFFQYHNTSYFGLAKSDCQLVGLPTEDTQKQHADQLQQLHKKALEKDLRKPNNSATNLANSSSSSEDEVYVDAIAEFGINHLAERFLLSEKNKLRGSRRTRLLSFFTVFILVMELAWVRVKRSPSKRSPYT